MCVPQYQTNKEYHAMVGPLIDRNKKQVLGTIQIYSSFQNHSENDIDINKANEGFNNEDEALFCPVLEIVSSVLVSLQNQQVRPFC